MLGRDLAQFFDPVLFAADAGLVCDPWQAALLRDQPKRCLLLASRQVGKSTTCALLALHTATFDPGCLVVVVSPSQRQSSEFIRTVKLMHQSIEGAAPLEGDSVTKLELANGSRIIGLPGGDDGKTVRGLAGARLILLDEASRIPDALMAAIRPMAATNPNAAMVALTTPAGRRGWFFDSWHGDAGWTKIKVSATDCPRISREFLEEERKALGQTLFESEYGLIFHDSESAMFSTAVIDGCFSNEVEPIWL
jgi:hypothetical protein